MKIKKSLDKNKKLEDIMKKSLGINVISNVCGVMPHTIRTWEKRYKIFSPDRSEGGQRLYSEDDLVKAKLIVSLLKQGHSISTLASQSLQDLRSLLITDDKDSFNSNKMLTSVSTKKLLQHLENFNIDLIASEMQLIRMSIGAKEFIFEIVLPVMHETERMVAKKKYSITQEHIISTIIRYQLGQINLANVGPNIDRFALATPEGNMHELPILIADIICHVNGVSTCYLGASHPAVCLSEAVNVLKCKTVVLGVTSSDRWDFEKNIVAYLKSMDKYLKNKVIIILGGGIEVNLPDFKFIENVRVIRRFEDFDIMLTTFD